MRSRLRLLVLVLIACSILTQAFAQKATANRALPSKTATSRVGGPTGMDADRHFQRTLANSQVRVFKVTIPANESTMMVAHPHDYLVVSLGANSFEAVGEANRFQLDMNDGDAQVLTGGWPHKLTNKTSHPADLLVVEVLHGIAPAQSVCGLGSKQCNQVRFGRNDEGSYNQAMLFETGKVRVFRVELGPGVALPNHNDPIDHLVLTISPTELSDGLTEATKESAGRAIWGTGRLATLRNTGTEEARMLILELK